MTEEEIAAAVPLQIVFVDRSPSEHFMQLLLGVPCGQRETTVLECRQTGQTLSFPGIRGYGVDTVVLN